MRSAALVLLVFATACSGGARAGVNVKQVASNLVYGVPKKVVPAAPPNFETPTEPVHVIIQGGNVGNLGKSFESQPPLTSACPKAPADKFPKKPALSQVDGRPAPGRYEWRVEGHEKTKNFGNVNLSPTTPKEIKGVQTTSNGFSYTVAERDLHFGSRATTETTYEVRSDGIYIAKIVSSVAGNSGTFTPTPAINIFPLPASIGNKIDATGIDPTTLEALRVQGTVPSRYRIDACGEPLDSFLVKSTETFIHGDGSQEMRTYNYGMATQLGGFIIFEHVDTPCNSQDNAGKCSPPPDLTFDARIGQVKPSLRVS